MEKESDRLWGVNGITLRKKKRQRMRIQVRFMQSLDAKFMLSQSRRAGS